MKRVLKIMLLSFASAGGGFAFAYFIAGLSSFIAGIDIGFTFRYLLAIFVGGGLIGILASFITGDFGE